MSVLAEFLRREPTRQAASVLRMRHIDRWLRRSTTRYAQQPSSAKKKNQRHVGTTTIHTNRSPMTRPMMLLTRPTRLAFQAETTRIRALISQCRRLSISACRLCLQSLCGSLFVMLDSEPNNHHLEVCLSYRWLRLRAALLSVPPRRTSIYADTARAQYHSRELIDGSVVRRHSSSRLRRSFALTMQLRHQADATALDVSTLLDSAFQMLPSLCRHRE